jgi:hypothetical protein
MRECPSNDFPRAVSRLRRLTRLLRPALAGIVVVAAGHAVQEVGSRGIGELLSIPITTTLCAAIAVDDPCAARMSSAAAVRPTASERATAAPSTADTPRWTGDELALPSGYNRWVLVGSSVGLGYSEAASGHESFHHVYLAPASYVHFREEGTFPEGTMLALEIREPAARVAPARQGSFAGRRLAVEIALKDSKRFKEGWAYFDFGDGRPAARALTGGRCEACHRQHGATDHVFTQFYSGLR